MSRAVADHDPAPGAIDDVLDPAWLRWALLGLGPDDRITAIQRLGGVKTVAEKVRFAVTTSGPDGERTAAYCVKGHFGDGIESLGTEARVYRDLLPSIDVRAPGAHYVGIDEGTGRALLVLDDLVSDGATFNHDAEPYPVDRCRQGLSQLARLHAGTWGEHRWDVDWLAPRIPFMMSTYAEGTLQQLLDDGRGESVPAEVLDARKLRVALEATDRLQPTCVVHGDTHSGNAYLDAQGRVCWLDWQISQWHHWSIDVAYHIGAVLDIEERRRSEEALLRGYVEELRSLGVAAPGWDEAWDAYRSGFARAFLLWTITCVSSRAVVLRHMPRLGTAIADHETFARLGTA